MSAYQSLENVLLVQTQKLQDLETATDIVRNKNAIHEELLNAYSEVVCVSKGIQDLKEEIKLMKLENDGCEKLSIALKKLERQIQHMGENIPAKIKEYVNSELPVKTKSLPKSKEKFQVSPTKTVERNLSATNGNHSITNMKNCKKVLFNEPDVPQIRSITQEEFVKIPKYIITRQTLEALNSLVSSINQIIKSKYLLLAMGKSGKKKAEVDLFVQHKMEQDSLGADKEKSYFFTAADYERTFKTKLDKSKLNLLVALRHCKKLEETRRGKTIFYSLVVSND
ncbi:spindle and kinetochore-associated protein 1-like [Copidosoma floridanum]|uniref:spindle and kinetochore-associated protein 1-like n=1 Tax=Copidosoma floridanum TaxID=29053 RepID=UPI0006C947BE|nr:spindle and kinetochore-associated protein 1-like [Copidosoma floridanum]